MALIDSLKAFERGMRRSAEIMVEIEPHAVIAPMMGSVPFIDCMAVENEDFFQGDRVYYMPASSSIKDVKRVMNDWLTNFLDDIVKLDCPTRIMGIDEVVSGNSAVRVYKEIEIAINQKKKRVSGEIMRKFDPTSPESLKNGLDFFDDLTDSKHTDLLRSIYSAVTSGEKESSGLLKQQLKEKVREYAHSLIEYKGIGIQDSKGKRNKEYQKIVADGKIIPVDVEAIVTMDKPRLCPAIYTTSNQDGYLINKPIVERFEVTPEYVAFLSNFATLAMKDPHNVNPKNLKRILESSQYLSEEFKR